MGGSDMVHVPTQQIPGVYHRRIGDIVVTALSDGYLDGTVDVLQNIVASSLFGVGRNDRTCSAMEVSRFG